MGSAAAGINDIWRGSGWLFGRKFDIEFDSLNAINVGSDHDCRAIGCCPEDHIHPAKFGAAGKLRLWGNDLDHLPDLAEPGQHQFGLDVCHGQARGKPYAQPPQSLACR